MGVTPFHCVFVGAFLPVRRVTFATQGDINECDAMNYIGTASGMAFSAAAAAAVAEEKNEKCVER